MSDKTEGCNDAPEEGMDWLLQNLIKLAEADVGVSVVLTTTGGTVAGTLISGKSYIAKLKSSFADSGNGQVSESLADWVGDFTKVLDEYNETGPYFIHLDKTRLSIGPSLTQPGGLWRGNLAHVTGFIVGTLS